MLFTQVLRTLNLRLFRSVQVNVAQLRYQLPRFPKFVPQKRFKMTQSLKEFVLELNTPFEELEVTEAFENLSEQERKYLHFYTKVDRDIAQSLTLKLIF